MRVGEHVIFKVSYGAYGSGVVETVNEAQETISVRDEDGSLWTGLMDHAESSAEQKLGLDVVFSQG